MRLLDRVFGGGDPRLRWQGEELDGDRVRGRIAGAARALSERCAPGDRVALHLPHGLAAPILLLACWEAGLVAVPIDLHLPEARVRELLERSGARLLVTEGRRGAALARRLEGVCPMLLLDGWPFGEAERAAGTWEDEAPACVLWTSGSTGVPKGVTIPRRAIDAFALHWMERLGLGRSDRVAWTAALSFDLTLLDVAAGLGAGATVVPVPEGLLAFPQELAAWLRAEAITCWYAVPSLVVRTVDAGLLTADGSSEGAALRVLLYAGEPMAGPDAAQIRGLIAPCVIFANLFGPTETNVSCAFEIPPDWAESGVPIGAPCPTIELVLLDAEGRRQPEEAGADGEIATRGGTTMLGYWGEPERASWVADAGGRWLRTGDRARWRLDGGLDFLGRLDRLVKIDGYRVEPDEVERALAGLPGVREAAVVAESRGDRWVLAAFVVGEGEPAEWERGLRGLLPAFAVPTRWTVLDALPRTERGKVDRGALVGG